MDAPVAAQPGFITDTAFYMAKIILGSEIAFALPRALGRFFTDHPREKARAESSLILPVPQIHAGRLPLPAADRLLIYPP